MLTTAGLGVGLKNLLYLANQLLSGVISIVQRVCPEDDGTSSGKELTDDIGSDWERIEFRILVSTFPRRGVENSSSVLLLC